MTRDQLDAIRARVEAAPKVGDTFIDENGDKMRIVETFENKDTLALLAEVERLREACTGLVKQNERQYDEVLRLTAERDAAFARGVAAMREAAVAVASKRANLPKHSDLDSAWCRSAECILDELRTLPDPEDTE